MHVTALLGVAPPRPDGLPVVGVADTAALVAAHRRLRHRAFVLDQQLFDGSDQDDGDHDPRTVVLVARDGAGDVLGGVRLAPCTDPDVGWWAGSRLVCRPGALGVGAALVRAACAHAETHGALRFDATVQARYERFFSRLGWERVRATTFAGAAHVVMRWPIHRLRRRAAVKRPIGGLVGALRPGGPWVGDDGVPVPGSDVVAATDAVIPSMLERDPWWAGWCGVLVNVNDLAAMGAPAVGLLDSLAAPTASLAQRIMAGIAAAAETWGAPILGGHTQVGVPAALTVTALGRTGSPVPGGGAQAGDDLHLTIDTGGGWRPGYAGAQWDSTSQRTARELRALHRLVAAARPRAAKDVSMAGIVGTVAMLAEASGTGALVDVASVPRPPAATPGDWLTCFPGFGMITAGAPLPAGPLPVTAARIGCATAAAGVRLRWPDGEVTPALDADVTGLGPAGTAAPHPVGHSARAAGAAHCSAPAPDREESCT